MLISCAAEAVSVFPKIDDAEWDNEDGAGIAEEQVIDIANEPL